MGKDRRSEQRAYCGFLQILVSYSVWTISALSSSAFLTFSDGSTISQAKRKGMIDLINKGQNIRHRWSKVLILILSVMFLLVIAGCSKDEDIVEQPANESPTSETPSNETPSTGEPGVGELDAEELKDLFRTGRALEEVHYEMMHTGITDEPMVTEIWIKGRNMKSKTEVLDNKVIMLLNDEGMYTLTEKEKVAMKIPLGDLADQFRKDTYSMEDYTENVEDAELVYKGKESVNGISCHVVESASKNGEGGIRMWLHEEYGFPMKMESMEKGKEGSFTMEVISFETGDVSDDEFLVPEDYKIMDFGSFNIPSLPVKP